MNALVTGAAGFLGKYIAEQLLARGDHVRALVRRVNPELLDSRIELRQVDLRNRAAVAAACAGIDVVFHVASTSGIWGPWDHFYGINTLGTEHVVAACLEHGVERLIYTSSPSVTFDGRDQCGVDESAPYPTKWLCYYPQTKALAEQQVLAANGRGKLRTCALRPHLIWGPRDRHLVPRLIDRARSGRLRRVGDGKNRIDMIYVENAAQAHLQAADALSPTSTVAGNSYFLSQGAPVNCWDWIDELLDLAGLPPVRKSISAAAAWRAGAMLESIYRLLRIDREPPMTRFLAAQLSTSHYFNISRAHRDFGYQPQLSTQEGMRRLAASLPNR